MMNQSIISQILRYVEDRIRQALVQYQHGAGAGPTRVGHLSNLEPLYVYPSVGLDAGAGLYPARFDHQHALYSGGTVQPLGTAASTGDDPYYLARVDHVHPGITLYEVDGAPLYSGIHTIILSNGSLSSAGAGYVTVTSGGGSLTVKEEDGAPNVGSVTEIRVSNGSLTDNGSGSVSIAFGESGAQNALRLIWLGW